MDIASIASTVVEAIKPLLAAGASAAVTTTGKHLAKGLLEKLKKRKAVERALDDTIKSGGDRESVSKLKELLAQEMEKDRTYAQDLVAYLVQAGILQQNESPASFTLSEETEVSASTGGIAIGGSVIGDVSITNREEETQ